VHVAHYSSTSQHTSVAVKTTCQTGNPLCAPACPQTALAIDPGSFKAICPQHCWIRFTVHHSARSTHTT
jgi:hypothetical protein